MNAPGNILAYLKDHLPAYPFDAKLDAAFVQEPITDFEDLDILEETKTFRWYYNNQPAARFRTSASRTSASDCADGLPTPGRANESKNRQLKKPRSSQSRIAPPLAESGTSTPPAYHRRGQSRKDDHGITWDSTEGQTRNGGAPRYHSLDRGGHTRYSAGGFGNEVESPPSGSTSMICA